jgi:hypothetical protein
VWSSNEHHSLSILSDRFRGHREATSLLESPRLEAAVSVGVRPLNIMATRLRTRLGRPGRPWSGRRGALTDQRRAGRPVDLGVPGLVHRPETSVAMPGMGHSPAWWNQYEAMREKGTRRSPP